MPITQLTIRGENGEKLKGNKNIYRKRNNKTQREH